MLDMIGLNGEITAGKVIFGVLVLLAILFLVMLALGM